MWEEHDPALDEGDDMKSRDDAARVRDFMSDEQLGMISYCAKDPVIMLSESDGVNYLMEVIDKSEAKVVILDPMQKMHLFQENDNQQMSVLMHELDRIMAAFKDRDLSLVMIHHYRKPPGDRNEWDPLDPYNFRGARWFSEMDVLMTMDRIEELRRPWPAWRNKVRFTFRADGNIPDSFFVFNDEGDMRMKFEQYVERPVQPVPERIDETPRRGFAPA
jgi:hypothetical protein